MNTPESQERGQQETTSKRIHWSVGAGVAALGALIGIVSLVFFCYAWGLNLQDEGWSAANGEAGVKNGPLVIAIICAVLATILFWGGFTILTRHHRDSS